MQYTIRNIPKKLDSALRKRAKVEKKSLNQVALEALARATGVSNGQEPVRHHDLDWAIGTWVEDPEFDRAIEEQDQVHPEDQEKIDEVVRRLG